MNTTIDITLRTRIDELLHALGKGLYEREEAVKLALLSAVAGESIFLLGPPGVGKSLVARRLKYAFRDGVSFEYLMSRFSTPDEVFGPVSIRKLKEEDKYERLTERYLPGANVVFLDEIWKAGPAIQNALLTILNEKIYRNGDQDLRVNIRGIIAASNELPPKSQSLDPIWDRFLLRLEMGNIRQFKHFLNMIVDTEDVYEDPIAENLKLTEAELEEWSRQIDTIEVPAEVLNTIQVIKIQIDEHNAQPNQADNPIPVYDRRWKKIIRLLRTSAFLNGRQQVDLMDCFLMIDCLWGKPEQREWLQELVRDAVRKHGYTLAVNLPMLKREMADFETDVRQETQVQHVRTEEQLLVIDEEYYELMKEQNHFEGSFITLKQFQQLQLGEEQVTNFYDAENNLVNRLKARRSGREHHIEVLYNDTSYTYPLRTRKAERTEVIFKKAHPVVQQFWDERAAKLSHFIEQQLKHTEQDAPEPLHHLEDNLFVDKAYSALVRANLEEVRQALQQLKLRLEKLTFGYSGDHPQ